MLYEAIGALGLSEGHYLLDVGCRDAAHTCELVRRYGCRAFGIDPVADNIRRAQKLIAEGDLAGRVRAIEGRIEAIPAGDQEFDFHLVPRYAEPCAGSARRLAECARVLKPGGQMLVYQTFATDLLEPARGCIPVCQH